VTNLLTLSEPAPGYHHVTLDNPRLNLFDPNLVAELVEFIGKLELDDTVKVVVFDSANPDYFMARVHLLRSEEFDRTPRPMTGLAVWPDIAARLNRCRSPRSVPFGDGSEH
jgi:enoyl-CoA hydratase/carnithine racemase